MERSTRGAGLWQEVGFVEAGLTGEGSAYRFEDRFVPPGDWSYRLDIVARDGTKEEYGPIDVAVSVPQEFELSEAYPNPFNPETEIRFQVAEVRGRKSEVSPSTSSGLWVKLRVYDLLGRLVATLVDEVRPAGRYTVKWNAGTASSGVYLLHLSAGGFNAAKKIVLIR